MTVWCALWVQAAEDSTGRQPAPVNWQPVLAAMALSPKQMRAAHEARLALGKDRLCRLVPLQIGIQAYHIIPGSNRDAQQSIHQSVRCQCSDSVPTCMCRLAALIC